MYHSNLSELSLLRQKAFITNFSNQSSVQQKKPVSSQTIGSTGDTVHFSGKKPKEPYNRRKHYGETPSKAQRREVQKKYGPNASLDHNPELWDHYYNHGGHRMSDAQRRAYANNRKNMSVSTRGAQNRQGAKASQMSKKERDKYFVKDTKGNYVPRGKGGGDPYFRITLPDGRVQRFNVHGTPNTWYDLLNIPATDRTSSLQLNGFFTAASNSPLRLFHNGTYITQVALNTSLGNSIMFDLQKAPVITRNGVSASMQTHHAYNLGDGMTAVWDQKSTSLIVKTPALMMQLRAKYFGEQNAYLHRDSLYALNEQTASGAIPIHGMIGQMLGPLRINRHGAILAQANGDRGSRAQGGGALETRQGDRVVLSQRGDRTVHENYRVSGPFAMDDPFSLAEKKTLESKLFHQLLAALHVEDPKHRVDVQSSLFDFVSSLPVQDRELILDDLVETGHLIAPFHIVNSTIEKERFALVC